MKKINVFDILKIIKDIFIKACIYFSAVIILFNILGKFMGNTSFALNILGTFYIYDIFALNFCFVLALASILAGAAAQVFKIKKLPLMSRHIAFFILLYLDFLLIIIPLSAYTVNQDSTLFLSVAFTVVYLIIFGIAMAIKAIINSAGNKKSDYEKQFKDVD
ncbi:MAG: hypothetical protein FWF92_10670 [Oscillospiraceae bacterium]|nr:hypothetical protein [Oscillospiraceae bacterium]